MIEEFVTHGNKQRLLVKLALFLNENHVSDDEISELLGDLIKYQDEEKPDISRKGRALVIDNQNMDNRLSILQRTISRMIPTGIGGTAISETVEMDAVQNVSDN
jgi:cobalamin-dependent methionine synthase I